MEVDKDYVILPLLAKNTFNHITNIRRLITYCYHCNNSDEMLNYYNKFEKFLQSKNIKIWNK